MIGLGTIANTLTVLVGGVIGLMVGKRLTTRFQETVLNAMALGVMVMSIGGILQEMLKAGADGRLESHGLIMMVISLAVGGFIGELLNIDKGFDRFGEWIKRVSHSENDLGFVNGFVTASLTFCVGAMAIVGAFEDGLKGNPNMLYLKAVMDGITAIIFTVAMGKGTIFSAVSILIYQGAFTILARLMAPIFTPAALSYLSYVGNVLILAIGWNMIHNAKKIRVANLLPAIVLAVLLSGII